MLQILGFVLERFFCFYLRVMGTGAFPPPLSPKEERILFLRMKEGDKKARETLIEHNLRLVAHIIKKYYTGCRDAEDLLSIGTIGLIKAIDTFDIENGARFATYAGKCLQNEILMHFRVQKRLSCETSINEAIEYDRDGNPLTYLDVICCEDDIVETLDFKHRCQSVRQAIEEVLSEREKSIIRMRYGLTGAKPLTQREVAAKLSISRSYVSRIEKGAMEKIRVYLKRPRSFF